MKINKYQWNETVEKSFSGKALTLSRISDIAKHLFDLAQNTDEYTKGILINEKNLKYTEVFKIDYATEERKFYKAYLQVNEKEIYTDYHKLFVW